MRKKRPYKVALGVREIMDQTSKAMLIKLVSGRQVWLSKKVTDIKLDEYGRRIAEIPIWLKKKIDNEFKKKPVK